MSEHDTTPLFQATLPQLFEEIGRRTEAYVAAFVSIDEDGAKFTFTHEGRIMNKVGLAHSLARKMDRHADDMQEPE